MTQSKRKHCFPASRPFHQRSACVRFCLPRHPAPCPLRGWDLPTAPAASEAGATVRCGLIASAVLDKTWAFLSRPETTIFFRNRELSDSSIDLLHAAKDFFDAGIPDGLAVLRLQMDTESIIASDVMHRACCGRLIFMSPQLPNRCWQRPHRRGNGNHRRPPAGTTSFSPENTDDPKGDQTPLA